VQAVLLWESFVLTKLLFGLAGLMLLGAAGLFGYQAAIFRNHAARADGVVIGLRAGGSHPTIQFHAAGGDAIKFDANGFIFGYSKGDAVRVLYDAAAPQRTAALAAVGSFWFWPISFSAIGLGFLAVLLPAR
jgi:hypothetical protein